MGRSKSEDKRRQIMRAAEALFAARRFHESTLEDVARQAGVGKGTIYRYFTDKDDLFFQTAAAGFDELCGLLRQVAPQGIPFRERLLAAVRLIHEFMEARHKVFGMMQTEDRSMSLCQGPMREQWAARRGELVATLAGIVREGQLERLLRSDIEPEPLASILMGMLRTRALDLKRGVGSLALDMVVDLFFVGAGAEPDRPASRRAARASGGRSRMRGPPAAALVVQERTH